MFTSLWLSLFCYGLDNWSWKVKVWLGISWSASTIPHPLARKVLFGKLALSTLMEISSWWDCLVQHIFGHGYNQCWSWSIQTLQKVVAYNCTSKFKTNAAMCQTQQTISPSEVCKLKSWSQLHESTTLGSLSGEQLWNSCQGSCNMPEQWEVWWWDSWNKMWCCIDHMWPSYIHLYARSACHTLDMLELRGRKTGRFFLLGIHPTASQWHCHRRVSSWRMKSTPYQMT